VASLSVSIAQIVPVDVAADVVALLSLAAGGVVDASTGGGVLSLAALTMTVRVALPMRPDWSHARYSMVCWPGADASIVTEPSVDVALSTSTVMPRFLSDAGELIIAPRSAYMSPTFTVAGLLPLMVMMGGSAPPEAEALPVAASVCVPAVPAAVIP
jgi:hypothetical protein